MTKAQIKQFNQMLATLKRIKAYQTPKQLARSSGPNYGLDYTEALEYAYENVLEEARRGSARIRPIKE